MAHITCIVRFNSLQHRFETLWSEHLLHKIESCNEVCLNQCSCDCSVETVIPCETPTDDKPCGQKGNPGKKGPAGSDGTKGCTGAKEFDSIRFSFLLNAINGFISIDKLLRNSFEFNNSGTEKAFQQTIVAKLSIYRTLSCRIFTKYQ